MHTWKELSIMQEKPKVIRKFRGYAMNGKSKNCLVIIDLMSCVHLNICKLNRGIEWMLISCLYRKILF